MRMTTNGNNWPPRTGATLANGASQEDPLYQAKDQPMLGTLRRHQPLCNLNVLKLGFQPPAPRTTSPAMAMTGAATLKRLMRPIASGPGGGGGGTGVCTGGASAHAWMPNC